LAFKFKRRVPLHSSCCDEVPLNCTSCPAPLPFTNPLIVFTSVLCGYDSPQNPKIYLPAIGAVNLPVLPL
jgi:hypothetical protein